MSTVNLFKILFPALFAFGTGILITPFVTNFLYKHQMWKKKSVKAAIDGGAATITASLHKDEERKVPRMGGVVIWASAAITILFFYILSVVFDSYFIKLSFLSRNQTWLPLFTLLAGGLFGLIDDYLDCRDSGTYAGGGLSLATRLAFVSLLGLFGAAWFYFKLDVSDIMVPFDGAWNLGLWFIPFFLAVIIAIYSGGIIDGVDGLSGGVFTTIYAAYAVIAFNNHQYDLAALCSVIVGGLLAFVWFNIPPARFFNSETGTMALTTTIVVIAFLTKAVLVLPIIALLLLVTSASSIIQILSKKYRGGKKIFLVAPLHNHFQALGWPPYKVTMRYWVVSIMTAIVGLLIHFAGMI